ncbi:hypothetical protein BDA96_06G194300 [Sorghum bicolor]|uniref:Uncharacterized protein n=1 Tax=Sorghum bicolor TaxID=4558 RepID=A0A921QUG1_SORBI|nr:hypothetical protein BDA96_06G194300 [Sorghum bicolor]
MGNAKYRDKNYGVIQTTNLATVCRGEQAAAPSFFNRIDARSIILDSISADPSIAKASGGSLRRPFGCRRRLGIYAQHNVSCVVKKKKT